MSGNRVDYPAEPVLAALQALIEILQSPRCIIKYASQLGKLIFSLDGNPMFEVSSRQHLGTFDELFKWPRDAARNDESQRSGNQQA